MDFEEYKKNVDVNDDYGFETVQPNRTKLYHGDLRYFYRNYPKYEYKKIRPLATAVYGLNNTDSPFDQNVKKPHHWNYFDAFNYILRTNPTCYVILSKPGTESFALGEALSRKYGCVHLQPRKIILDEIEQESPTGRCIDFNLRHNKVCRFDIILSMLKIKVNSQVVKHRGYVISGFPLVTTNNDLRLFIETLHSEDSVRISHDILFETIANLNKKKKKHKKPAAESLNTSLSQEFAVEGQEQEQEEEEEEEEEHMEEIEEEEEVVKLPDYMLDTCSDVIHLKQLGYLITTQACFLKQLNAIWNLDLKPDVIIYITNTDINLVQRKDHRYIDYKKNKRVRQPLLALSVEKELRWPPKYSLRQHHALSQEVLDYDIKYSCQQPFDFQQNTVEQMCNYRNYVHYFIEQKMKDYNPKFLIKVDGRSSVDEMMYYIAEKKLTLSIRPVRIPSPLYIEDPPEDLGEFWQLVEETNYIQVSEIKFSSFISPWHNICPVELSKRRTVRGESKFAVRFMKFVFILSSLKNMITFSKNPRPFLQIEYLEPPCRFFISGTKLSGKTLVSRCLSWLFDVPIISYNSFAATQKQRKYEAYAKGILSEVIAPIEDSRLQEWQVKEDERIKALRNFLVLSIRLLKNYIPLLQKYLESIDLKSMETIISEHDDKNFNDLRNSLRFLPDLDNVQECKLFITDSELLKKFAPVELSEPVPKPLTPQYGDDDVTVAIEEYINSNDLRNNTQPSTEELMIEFTGMLSEIDKQSLEFSNTYGRYIIDDFPSDLKYWEHLSKSNLLPDTTITLIEKKDVVPELLEHYKYLDISDLNYQTTFLKANDPLIRLKLLTKSPDDLDDTIEEKFEPDIDPEEWADEFGAEVIKFVEDWGKTSSLIKENKKSFIEIKLEDQSGVEVIEEVLKKLRQIYNAPCLPNFDDTEEDEENLETDYVTYNNLRIYGDTNKWCPIAYYDYGVLWEGKTDFTIKHLHKTYFFSKEEFPDLMSSDPVKYETFVQPYKKIPPFRICVTGCIGSGKTSIAQFIAKELGLVHIDFLEYINDFIIPKHFKKVGFRYENQFTKPEEEEEMNAEFMMDEGNPNILSEMMFNEPELRNVISNYIEGGLPMYSPLMQNILKKIWFDEPFRTYGFVLDGFPKMSSDIEEMTATFCIPDMVLQLQGDVDVSVDRLTPNLIETWKIQLQEAKALAKIKFVNANKKWFDFIAARYTAKVTVEELVYNLFSDGLIEPDAEEQIHAEENVEPEEDFMKDIGLRIYTELIEETPPPERQTEWEKQSEARERIEGRLQNIYEVEEQNIENLEDALSDQNIKLESVDTSKPMYKIFRYVLSKLSYLRVRNESFFEQTVVLDSIETGEKLLLKGLYFLSRFFHMCPVHIYENKIIITNPYRIFTAKNECYCVLHRCYMYFLFGKTNLIKFRKNPLKYLKCDNVNDFIEYPLRISVLGPPKSGKSTLAAAIAKEYGLLCISKGMGVRYMLETMAHAITASKMISDLREGKQVNNNLALHAVRAAALDERTTSLGVIYDGFPIIPDGAMELDRFGLYPQIVLDICTTEKKIEQNSENEIYLDILRLKPPYPVSLILERYSNWLGYQPRVRDWIQNDYQNLYKIDGTGSKWQTHQNAKDVINDIIRKIYFYLHNHNTASVVPMDAMCVSNELFERNMSSFKNVCPLCFKRNIFKNNLYPLDKKGLLLYNGTYYWFCKDHLEIGLQTPEMCHLNEEVQIPELPVKVTAMEMSYVYENGVCIVTYADNLPRQIIVQGVADFAARYKTKTYLFCGNDCFLKFLYRPYLYYDIKVFEDAKIFRDVSINELPDIGYLEQSVGELITRACCSVNALRPKYPGLDVNLSGALYIALFLKAHNPRKGDKDIFDTYNRMFRVYEARCRLIVNLGLRLRSMQNPFASYPKCCSSGDYHSLAEASIEHSEFAHSEESNKNSSFSGDSNNKSTFSQIKE